jgi:putative aldouronate transport system permease protein
MKESLGDRLLVYMNVVLLCVIGLVTLFPLYYVFAVSFTDPLEYSQKQGFVLFPIRWSLDAYKQLLSSGAFMNATWISTFLATVGTALSLIVTAAFAFGLSRKRLHGRRLMLILILLTILFNPGIIPNYLVVREIGLINSVWSLIIPVLTSGWYVILMKSFFDSIPVELEEAAMIDGSNDLNTFFRIMLPLSTAAMATFGLFYAVGYWNTFFHAILYINDFSKAPLQIILRNMLLDSDASAGGGDNNVISTQMVKMAAVVLATVPVMLVYPFLQKHFTKGVMLGSVKG